MDIAPGRTSKGHCWKVQASDNANVDVPKDWTHTILCRSSWGCHPRILRWIRQTQKPAGLGIGHTKKSGTAIGTRKKRCFVFWDMFQVFRKSLQTRNRMWIRVKWPGSSCVLHLNPSISAGNIRLGLANVVEVTDIKLRSSHVQYLSTLNPMVYHIFSFTCHTCRILQLGKCTFFILISPFYCYIFLG